MTTDGLPGRTPRVPDVTNDLVVVLPGIMGSRLRDRELNREIWGLKDPRWYVRAWARPSGLDALAVSPSEQDLIAEDTFESPAYDPATARVEATGLLEFPAWMPLLAGVEPYTDLFHRLRTVVAAPEAVVPFPYDWRLPVTLNARLLATTITERLEKWRTHPAQHEAAALHQGRDPKAVLVAHSMGGLVAAGLSLIPGATDAVRMTITLGTPFHGSVKAAALLAHGRGVPLPAGRVRAMAATLPGLHDLLPTHRCTVATSTDPTSGAQVEDLARLSVADVEELGGDPVLTDASFDRLALLQDADLVGHRAVVGIHQPTGQSLRLRAGDVEVLEHYFLRHDDGELVRDGHGRLVECDLGGDGTVYRYAAAPDGFDGPWHVTQQHGALATTRDTLGLVCGAITGRPRRGVYLGPGDLGLHTPDTIPAGQPLQVTVTGDGGPLDPAAVTGAVHDTATGRAILPLRLAAHRDRDDALTTAVPLPAPGLYRIAVKTGGADPVTRLVLCTDPSDSGRDDS